MFPDPMLAGQDGLLCVGGDLEVETLLEAYRLGIFPWPKENYPLLWFFPYERGVLDFSLLHWPDRFERDWKKKKQKGITLSFNRAFAQVIQNCAAVPRTHETGTWILPPMIDAYVRMHKAGHAHSVECWLGERLVGGMYGVFVDGVFSGESMFHLEDNASKFCLRAMVEYVRDCGLGWLDVQMVTPVLEQFGAAYEHREVYARRLKAAQAANPGAFAKATLKKFSDQLNQA